MPTPERPLIREALGRVEAMADSYDVIVVGTGPGGYVAAIRAAQLGLKTAVVESDDVVGGRCLNYACIPAKTLLRAAELLDEVEERRAEQGVIAKDVSIDFPKLHERREAVRKTLTGGVAGLFKKNKIEVIQGEGSLTEDGNVKVGDTIYETKNVILATGSVALPIPGVEFGDRDPRHLGRLVAAGAAEEHRRRRRRRLRLGDRLRLHPLRRRGEADRDARPDPPRRGQGRRPGRRAHLQEAGHRGPHRRQVENVEAGRARSSSPPATRPRGRLHVHRGRPRPRRRGARPRRGRAQGRRGRQDRGRRRQKTSVEGIYAIGDLTPGPALAHKASEEGIVAAEKIAGQKVHPIDLDSIAGATFCHPQVASVGLTEAAAKEAGHEVKTGKFKLGGVGAGAVYDDRDGMVKLVVDAKYGEILGAHIVGNRACDMIAELVAIKDLEGGYQELTRIIHPHPTISESIPEAARAVDGWAIHA